MITDSKIDRLLTSRVVAFARFFVCLFVLLAEAVGLISCSLVQGLTNDPCTSTDPSYPNFGGPCVFVNMGALTTMLLFMVLLLPEGMFRLAKRTSSSSSSPMSSHPSFSSSTPSHMPLFQQQQGVTQRGPGNNNNNRSMMGQSPLQPQTALIIASKRLSLMAVILLTLNMAFLLSVFTFVLALSRENQCGSELTWILFALLSVTRIVTIVTVWIMAIVWLWKLMRLPKQSVS